MLTVTLFFLNVNSDIVVMWYRSKNILVTYVGRDVLTKL